MREKESTCLVYIIMANKRREKKHTGIFGVTEPGPGVFRGLDPDTEPVFFYWGPEPIFFLTVGSVPDFFR